MGDRAMLITQQDRLGFVKTIVVMTMGLLLSGCFGNQTKSSVTPEQAELYEGKAILSYLAEQQARTPEEAMTLAERAIQSGDSDRALYQYIRAFELDNANPQPLLEIAAIHYERGNYQTSYLAYQRALSLNSNLTRAHQGSGMILLHRKQYDLAEQSFTEAISLYNKANQESEVTTSNPATDIYESYNSLGIINDIRGRYQTAILNYKAALEFNAKTEVIRNNLGYSYYMQNRWQESEDEFLKALKSDQSYIPAWKNLGLVYARQERYSASLDALEQVMDTAQAYNDIGYICLISGRYDQAAYFFRKAISESPQYYTIAQQNLTRVKRILARDPAGRSSL